MPMTIAERLQNEFVKIGYSSIRHNYVFSDVFSSPPLDRTAELAAFTHTPPSYRNAALALVSDMANRATDQLVSEYRALGAPLVFVIEGSQVSVWQVRSEERPRLIARRSPDNLPALFGEFGDQWHPQTIQRAKSIGHVNRSYQLDFVDAGLLVAIEGEVHAKLDRLIRETLAEALDAQNASRRVDARSLFRTVFRLIASKILKDRSHPLAQSWNSDDIRTILDATSRYYDLPLLEGNIDASAHSVFSAAWRHIRSGINFQNISSDDLAYVYENTLVTRETRKRLGTHSTPWQVVEYVVDRLGLEDYEPENVHVYEPCAGAAVFLVAVLRRLREELPRSWTDQQRHNFLVGHLSGDEIDSFAVEVAKLSLILADYPNHDGWQINEVDVFEADLLSLRMGQHNVIVCNPPFSAITKSEQVRYQLPKGSLKHSVLLNAALDARPMALGFVLPRTFIREKSFLHERRRVAEIYNSIELVDLPEGTFRESEAGAALLIARELRHQSRPPASISVTSTEVVEQDRERFLKTGEVTTQRRALFQVENGRSGDLWIPPLASVWDYLSDNPCLGSFVVPHLGERWTYDQQEAVADEPKEGFAPGVFGAEDISQFKINHVRYLDVNPTYLTHAKRRSWSEPKVIVNDVRLSRGAWRLAAAVDRSGLVFSQQLFGLWPRDPSIQLEAVSAILNSPLGNAFVATHSPSERFRLSTVSRLPLPTKLSPEFSTLVNEYISALAHERIPFREERRLQRLLLEIDAAVLRAYDLPPRLEKELLEFFRHSKRPVMHDWQHWFPERFAPFIPLHKFISDEYRMATTPWVEDVFTPLPEEEAAGLRKYMD
jgi:hypothetical protein